jgi:hypothetical protein
MKKIVLLITALMLIIGSAFPQWIQKNNFTGSARHCAVSFSIGSKGYVGTGNDNTYKKDFWEYDPGTNTWSQKANFGGTGRTCAVGLSIGNKGYIGTGDDGTNTKDFWEYDPVGNTWTKKADFGGVGRQKAVAFSIGNKGYVGTGCIGVAPNFTYYKDFWEYNQDSNKWSQKKDFGGSARLSAVGFSIGNKGYIGTGKDASALTKDFWQYDPAGDTWTKKADVSSQARVRAIGFSIGGKGYIGTGFDGSSTHFKDFWEYDTLNNTWTKKKDFGGVARRASISFSIGNKGYIGTGFTGSANKNDLWEYDINAAVNELTAENKVRVYPNPATDRLYVEAQLKARIEIINNFGQVMKSVLSADKLSVIDVSDMPNGVYFINLITDNGSSARKFIKTY